MNSVAPNLSGDSLIQSLIGQFEKVPDHRNPLLITFKLSDILMSGFSIFALKFPSLLQFDEEMRKKDLSSRLRPVFRLEGVPSDTQLRAVVDGVDPVHLKKPFKHLFKKLQRAKKLKEFEFYDGKYLIDIDGTQHFTSTEVHCDSCMQTTDQDGNVRYHHQMLGGCIVHPDKAEVIPLCPEAIRKQDGQEKNDCEQNALTRFLNQLRSDHPKLPIILTADAIHTNNPRIKSLLEVYQMSYILAVKPGSHQKLFEAVGRWEEQGQMVHVEFEEEIGDKVKKHCVHHFRFMNRVLLNHQDVNLSTNFFEYWETTQWVHARKHDLKEEARHFSWVTDFEITKENIMQLMRGGRARWKIENETFNTLKNQGYEFEHNFGHGYKNLSTNFAHFMFLAFLFDQIQKIGSRAFQTVLKTECFSRLCRLWDLLRSIYKMSYRSGYTFKSWHDLLVGNLIPTIADTS